MLHILLLILKIIGIIILAVLGIAVLLVGVVLFVPVRYSFEAETPGGLDKLKLFGRATWLFSFATAHISYSDKKLDWKVRVLWKRFRAEDKSVEDPSAAGDENTGKSLEESEPKAPREEGSKATERGNAEKETVEQHKTLQQSTKRDKTKKKKQNIFDKIRYTISNICDKIKKILETKDKIIEFISDEVHQAAFGRVTKEFIALIRYLRPRKLKGYIHFGFAEPYDTGRALALLSVLYPFYGEKIQIEPEFERKVLEGHITMRGRAHVFPFVLTVCRLFLDKNVMTAYKNFRRK